MEWGTGALVIHTSRVTEDDLMLGLTGLSGIMHKYMREPGVRSVDLGLHPPS